jgi:2-polyprenyl-3-methyl-5-hydroxy-6-metoxy-1,4-benzoquinol methylase
MDNILDLGCGNGELARALAMRGHGSPYVGLDFCAELLTEARGVGQGGVLPCKFIQADLSTADWDAVIGAQNFEVVLAFAVLHHLPGDGLRRQILRKVHRLLSPKGRFIHSEWQFLNSSRLRKRIQPWETVGLTAAEVERGDYILDWRSGGLGLRYVHHFSIEELAALAEDCGFRIAETFFSDGEGGKLAVYQVWRSGDDIREE